jgi:hypothetical protein
MIPITTESRYNAMINLRKGLISREIFSDKEVFEEELEKVFTRSWLFVGHESQIPNPGDYFTSRMGAESVILARDKKKKVHVFLNSCRHRGMKVCQYDHGTPNSSPARITAGVTPPKASCSGCRSSRACTKAASTKRNGP